MTRQDQPISNCGLESAFGHSEEEEEEEEEEEACILERDHAGVSCYSALTEDIAHSEGNAFGPHVAIVRCTVTGSVAPLLCSATNNVRLSLSSLQKRHQSQQC